MHEHVEPPDLQVHTSTIHLLDLVGAQMSADVKTEKRTSQDKDFAIQLSYESGKFADYIIYTEGLADFGSLLQQKQCHFKG